MTMYGVSIKELRMKRRKMLNTWRITSKSRLDELNCR